MAKGSSLCLECGTRLPLYLRLTDAEFCSPEHRDAYQREQQRLALERLIETEKFLTLALARRLDKTAPPARDSREDGPPPLQQALDWHPPAALNPPVAARANPTPVWIPQVSFPALTGNDAPPAAGAVRMMGPDWAPPCAGNRRIEIEPCSLRTVCLPAVPDQNRGHVPTPCGVTAVRRPGPVCWRGPDAQFAPSPLDRWLSLDRLVLVLDPRLSEDPPTAALVPLPCRSASLPGHAPIAIVPNDVLSEPAFPAICSAAVADPAPVQLATGCFVFTAIREATGPARRLAEAIRFRSGVQIWPRRIEISKQTGWPEAHLVSSPLTTRECHTSALALPAACLPTARLSVPSRFRVNALAIPPPAPLRRLAQPGPVNVAARVLPASPITVPVPLVPPEYRFGIIRAMTPALAPIAVPRALSNYVGGLPIPLPERISRPVLPPAPPEYAVLPKLAGLFQIRPGLAYMLRVFSAAGSILEAEPEIVIAGREGWRPDPVLRLGPLDETAIVLRAVRPANSLRTKGALSWVTSSPIRDAAGSILEAEPEIGVAGREGRGPDPVLRLGPLDETAIVLRAVRPASSLRTIGALSWVTLSPIRDAALPIADLANCPRFGGCPEVTGLLNLHIAIGAQQPPPGQIRRLSNTPFKPIAPATPPDRLVPVRSDFTLAPVPAAATLLEHLVPGRKWLRIVLIAVPVLMAGMWLAGRTSARPSPPPVSSAAGKPDEPGFFAKSFSSVQTGIGERAGIQLFDDFRSGLGSWVGDGEGADSWKFDQTGFVKPNRLAVYRPTLEMSNYTMEFLAEVDQKALSWVFRAQDPRHYYVAKLIIVQPGPLPKLALRHWAVIGGKDTRAKETVLALTIRGDALFDVKLEAKGPDFTVYIGGRQADFWTDPRLAAGGVGFFSGNGELSRIRWLRIEHQYDVLGRLCAYLAPSAKILNRSNGSWK